MIEHSHVELIPEVVTAVVGYVRSDGLADRPTTPGSKARHAVTVSER